MMRTVNRKSRILDKSVIFVLVIAVGAVFAPGKPRSQGSSFRSHDSSGKAPAEELSLVVTMVTGERSRDSNSTTTSLTVTADTLRYEQSYHGAHSNRRAPVKKEYNLTKEDRNALIRVMHEKNLLVNRTFAALPQEDEPSVYFSLAIRSKLNGDEHSITINGPRNAAKMKADRIYQDSVYLVAHLFKIINRTDPDTSMPELISSR